MPYYRCGARQVDPEQGKSSPWKRGVHREHQVLICPDCAADAFGELDHCSGCGGTHLIRRLDQVECLACGLARDANPDPEAGPGRGSEAGPGRGSEAGPGRKSDASPGREAGAARETGTEPSPVTATAPPSSPSLSPSPRREPQPSRPATLSDEVASALDRVLRRG